MARPQFQKKIYTSTLGPKWKGKIWQLLGDSITWYDTHAYPDNSICVGYPSLVKNELNIKTMRNNGVSGASMAESSSYPTNGSIFDVGYGLTYYDVDLITIFAGTNDFKLNVNLGVLGVIGDTTWDNTTFYGSYRHLIEAILSQNPMTKIYLMTPLQRDNGGYDVNFVNTAGFKLIDYVNAVKNVGQMYGIPVLDLYSDSGFTKRSLGSLTIDNLHPNNAGHLRIADMLKHFIEQN